MISVTEMAEELRERIANLENLARRNADLERENADLKRQVSELRAAIDALMQPAPSELLAKNLAHPSRK